MPDLAFAFVLSSTAPPREASILAESIRTFGGAFAGSRILALVPEGNLPWVPAGVEAVTYAMGPAERAFPLADKPLACAAAEAAVEGCAHLLVFLAPDSVVVQEPLELILPAGAGLGCRPVDLALIGPRWDQPVTPYWRAVYQFCETPVERLFPVVSSVDQVRLRAYFNAGMMVVRPERGLLRRWAHNFLRHYRRPDFKAFCREDEAYAICLHQAMLAGTALAMLEPHEIHLLPAWVNYPLHLHDQYPAELRPPTVNDLITFRSDDYSCDPTWLRRLPVREPLRSWLAERLNRP